MPKPILVVLPFIALLLSGCATIWHRPGTPKTVMEQNLGHCQMQAAKDYPPKIVVVRTAAGYWNPATRQCWRSRHSIYCQQYPANWSPATYGNQDLNAPARHAWVRACMRGLGYHGSTTPP